MLSIYEHNPTLILKTLKVAGEFGPKQDNMINYVRSTISLNVYHLWKYRGYVVVIIRYKVSQML